MNLLCNKGALALLALSMIYGSHGRAGRGIILSTSPLQSLCLDFSAQNKTSVNYEGRFFSHAFDNHTPNSSELRPK